TRTLRIRQSHSFNFSTEYSTSPLRAVTILPYVIFIRFRGPRGPNWTESSIVAWLCLRRCHVTPGSPNFFEAGFRCLRKRFHRSNGKLMCMNIKREINSVGSAIVVLRSEEHTSELQSRENLVCRLLLEKKKKKNK